MSPHRSPVAFGQYIITRRIARGGMAEIYRARTRHTADEPSRWVAVKMMRTSLGHEDLREKLFKREARIASMIQHDNVIPLYQFGMEMERYFIAMEYVRGRDVSHLLRKDKSAILPFELSLYIGLNAAAGLGHAHRLRDEHGEPLGIVHRDMSPGNVMIGYDGSVKVLDFGVARINEHDGMQTQTGTLRGKFAYMSPEQTLGEALDARSDVFSLGTVLYELLTGNNCFRTDDPLATLERVQRLRPVPPSRTNHEIPQTVDRILARCLAKDRNRRFPDGIALHEAIAEFLDKRKFDGRAALTAHMSEIFATERDGEEQELLREEEEVALFDVVDFALIGEDRGLDAANMAVSLEEEASKAAVSRVVDRSSIDGEDVFESEDPGIHAVLWSRQGQLALPVAAGEFTEESERKTVARGLRFDDPDDTPERGPVELSSLLGNGPTSNETSGSRSGSMRVVRGEPAPHLQPQLQPRPESLKPVLVDSRNVGREPSPRTDGRRFLSPTPSSNTARFETEKAPVLQVPSMRALLAHPGLWALLVAGAVVGVTVLISIDLESNVPSEANPAPREPKPAKVEPAELASARPAAQSKPEGARFSAEPRPEPVKEAVPPGDAKATTVAVAPPATSRRASEPPHTEAEGTKPEKLPSQHARPPSPPSKPTPAKVAAKPAASSKDKQVGYLNVGAKPWAEIAINGKPWPYQTPQAGIELPIGKHVITLHNRDTGVTHTETILISPGSIRTISVDMRKK